MHVRNISASGALIEGAIVLNQGDRVILKRGSLEAPANVIWKAGRKAGISFCSVIVASDWMARQQSAQQGRVDAMIHAIRSGAGNGAGGAGGPRAAATAQRSIEAQLEELGSTLAALEQGLIGDVILIATHPEIQLIDIARQAVERMLRTVRQN